MARILLIDTSTAQLSTALAEDGAVTAFRICGEPRMQAALTAPYVNVSETTLNVISFALILIVISVAVVLVAKLLTKVAELAMLGWLDKTLGLVFALAVNALVIGVVIILFDTVNTMFELVKPEVLDASVVYTSLRDLSYLVFPYLKSFFFKQ